MTSYIRMRLNIQNEKNWSQDRALGDPTSQQRRRGCHFIHNYYLCPVLQVITEEEQSKIKIPKVFLSKSQN